MTGYNFPIIAIGLVVIGWGARVYAEGDVTIYTPPPSTNAAPAVAMAPDGTPVVHKSLHKKKKAKTVIAAATPTSQLAAQSSTPSAPTIAAAPTPKPPAVVTQAVSPASVPGPPKIQIPPTGPIVPGDAPASLVPTVETGLPIARHSTTDPVTGAVATYGSYPIGLSSYHPLPSYTTVTHSVPVTTTSAGTYSTASRSTTVDDITFTDYEKKQTRTYPWKRDIFTTMFYIGEGGSSISSTDNVGSAWDADWRDSNHGSDTPDDRDGYAPAHHAATVTTFYCALPFNDLAYPEKARRWLPAGWYRPPRDGKQVSACQGRWVEIKNEQGDTCYAQWEDVGPLRSDHAEYVFGPERPDTYTRAGLDVSPAVYKYLNLDGGRNRYTSWRFVDDADVPPGFWLKYDEQAVLYRAIHELRNQGLPGDEPIQRSIAPLDDPSNIDSNKKKVGAAKG